MIKYAWELEPGDEVHKSGKVVMVEMVQPKGCSDVEINFSDGTFRYVSRSTQFAVVEDIVSEAERHLNAHAQ